VPPARGSKSRVLPEQAAGIGDDTGGAHVSAAVSGVRLVALPGQLGELAAGGDAYGGLSRQSSARDVGCNSGGRSCQSCRQVRPCDVSGLHSEEALTRRRSPSPPSKSAPGIERTRPTYPRTSRIAPSAKRAYPANPRS
jgi:hypothetical protein